nr:adenylate kinase isoenzyme 1-like [Rhipicephalus microplus]
MMTRLSERESKSELRRQDRQQPAHLCRLICSKQFIKLSDMEKKDDNNHHQKDEKRTGNAKRGDPVEPLDVKVPVIFVFGGPGSGKGTQCEKIVQKYGFTHICPGDLLRAEAQSGSDRGEEMNEIMKKGELVPLDILLQLLKEAIKKHLDKAKGFLIDGYPRNVEQGDRFEAEVCKSTNLIYFEVKDETMHARLLKRGLTSGRADDNEETIVKRIKTFHVESEHVLDKYRGIVHKVSAEDDPDKVFASLTPFFDTITKPK